MRISARADYAVRAVGELAVRQGGEPATEPVKAETIALAQDDWVGASGVISAVVHVLPYALWAAALTYSIRAYRREKAEEPASEERQPVTA